MSDLSVIFFFFEKKIMLKHILDMQFQRPIAIIFL